MDPALEAWPSARSRPLFDDDEIELLRASFLRLIPCSEEMSEALYAHLFELQPEARKLFNGPMDEQREKVVRMLATMVDALSAPGRFEAECRASGERHRRVGVDRAHYAPLGWALVAAMRDTMIPPPTIREEELWIRLYAAAMRLMVEERLPLQ